MGEPESLLYEVDEIVQVHMKLVHKLAQRFRWAISGTVDYQDLVSEGVVGLLKAWKRYDVHRGNKFATFAIPWIMNGIRAFIRDKGAAVRTPQKVYQRTGAILRKGLHSSSSSAVSTTIGCSEKHARESLLYLHNSKISYLDMPLGNTKGDSDATLADTLALKEDKTAEDVERFIHALSSEEQQLLELRMQQVTLINISRVLRKTPDQVKHMLTIIGEKAVSFLELLPGKEVQTMVELTKEKYIEHKRVDDLPDSKICEMYAIGDSALHHRKRKWKLIGTPEARNSSARGIQGVKYSQKPAAKSIPESKPDAQVIEFEKVHMELELEELRKENLTLKERIEFLERFHQTETVPQFKALQKETELLKALLKNYL